MRSRSAHTVLLLAVVATALACMLDGCSTARTSTSLPTQVPQLAGSGASRIREYHSLSDLAADASAVVLVHGTGHVRTEIISNARFTVATVAVDDVLAGSVNGATTLDVHTVTTTKSGEFLLASADPILLFVKPFYVNVGAATGEWIPAGEPAGTFIKLTDGRYHTVDPESPDLPAIDPSTVTLPKPRTAEFFFKGDDIPGG